MPATAVGVGASVGLVHAIVLGEVDLWRDFYLVHDMNQTRKRFIELMPSTPLTAVMRDTASSVRR